MLSLDEIPEELIQKAREVEGAIKKITKKARLEKSTLDEKYKKMARESEEMLAVKRMYKGLRKDLYEERNEHIKSIPNFWPTAFLNYSRLRKQLSEEDAKIIRFLKSVVVEVGQNDERVITFFFGENEYFVNTFLKTIYSRTDKGILVHKQGTKILWKATTTGAGAEILGGIPWSTDIDKSFFTLVFDPKDKGLPEMRCDKVLETIEEHLWPRVLGYYLNWCAITEIEVEEGSKEKIALHELKVIQDKLEEYDGKEYRGCMEVEEIFGEKALEEQVLIEQKCSQERKPLYQERNEIVKTIPKFWLLAFISHYALGDLFGVEDQKIFRCVDSVDVVDNEDVTSGYTITLNFDNNPYFSNQSLTKRISFCEDGTTNLSAVMISWKVNMDISTEYLHHTPLTNAREMKVMKVVMKRMNNQKASRNDTTSLYLVWPFGMLLLAHQSVDS
ncbi:hypothetical protein C5167_007975 [Papaver somniferum]|uniref:Nucleosome assembly protein n=1 Tax=Papaver somniferum TaxID=3469 RepID=A0A4Y7JWE1_PAPSO|nr:NAP1-related protein 1-like isoform X2 [Papaver somniferum]RZC64291.1 hypothetical protein C5167_007975 [Papaver somniferum]